MTVIRQLDESVIVETADGEHHTLNSTEAGLCDPNNGELLASVRVIGTRPQTDVDELHDYLFETCETAAEVSATALATEFGTTTHTMTEQLSRLQGELRSGLLLTRESYDRWNVYHTGRGPLSTSAVIATLQDVPAVDRVDFEDGEIACTFTPESTAVPKGSSISPITPAGSSRASNPRPTIARWNAR
ncbi:hypothetical protein ACFQRB_19070 [Halobaculum litoreum]|uniref:Uncharacterized protein n=1 Tax=Halobaculum litoreum TaxID=3031998 RepID=A0ABD5XX65_9EURY